MDGADLKAYRERLGLSQTGLAEQLGVTSNTVARWEREEMGIPPYLGLALKSVVPAPPKNPFGDYLRMIVKEQRLSLNELANRVKRKGKEVSVSYLHELMIGKRHPSRMTVETLQALALGLGRSEVEVLYAALGLLQKSGKDDRLATLASKYAQLSPKGKDEVDITVRLLESLITERIEEESR